jgi:hypothetical protein
MKYLDFGIQTLIFGFAFVLLITALGESGWLLSILYAQLLMGPWQFFSSLISVAARAEFHQAKRIHLIISIVYLLILWGGVNAERSLSEQWVSIFLTVPPWILAIYYYSITCQWTFQTKSRGSFLRHLNF